jgi:hypothetical protein
MIIDTTCDATTQSLAIIGGLAIFFICWALISAMTFACVSSFYKHKEHKKYSELTPGQKGDITALSILFPIAIIAGICYLLFGWRKDIAMKKDLKETEVRLTNRINQIAPPSVIPSVTPFRVGDFVTGVRGNPGGYTHLTEGSKSKVLSIDDRGQMSLLLLDHKDYLNHRDAIGKTFKGPSRNFIRWAPNFVSPSVRDNSSARRVTTSSRTKPRRR